MSKSGRLRTAEHDAFGPWVLLVHRLDHVPPLFRPTVDLTDVRLAVKFPRPIERRHTHPDMDLYDHLVLIRGDQIEIISRVESARHGWERQLLMASEILAVENSLNLLDGRLRLHATAGRVTELAYNGVSEDLMGQVVDQIRSFWRPPTESCSPDLPLPSDALGENDIGLANHFRALARRDRLLSPVILRQRQIARPATKTSPTTRLSQSIWPTQLHGVILATTGSELVVVHRRNWLTQKRRPEHSLATTVVPSRSKIKVETNDNPNWSDMRELRLAPTTIKLIVTADDGIEPAVIRLTASGESSSMSRQILSQG